MGEVILGIDFRQTTEQTQHEFFVDEMEAYYADCALTGSPVSPQKAKFGDPGIIRTADGDLLCITPDKDSA